ncbi:MAG: anti-sigma factor antagonist, partial [Chloroflexi bacterium]|nr:anti-sigma factor antagonist [Chloroflexota bacterium]
MPNQSFKAILRQPVMQLDGAVIIDLHGEINSSVEAALNSAYDRAEAEDKDTIILNFSDVSYMNSTGIALIVGLLARARKTHRTLTVFGLSEHYADIFNITRLADFMNILPDEQSALKQVHGTIPDQQ